MTDRYQNLDSDGSFDAGFSEEYEDDEAGYGAHEEGGLNPSEAKHEADLQYKTVVILAQKTFRPRDFMRNYDSKNPTDESKWELRNSGIISLSFLDGSLKIESGNKEDFKEMLRQMSQKGTTSSIKTNPNTGTGTKGTASQKPEYTDLIKSIKIKDMTSNWEKSCVLEFKTIPALIDDFNYSKTGNVIFSFLNGTLSSTKPKDFDILSRAYTKGNVELEKKFPGATHSNVKDTIIPLGGDYNYVPFNGVLHAFGNLVLPPHQKITSPSAIIGTQKMKVVEMTKAQTEAALKLAERELGNTIIRGDVTNNFRVTLAAQPNSIREAQHRKWKESEGKEGREWRGFADAFNVLPKGTEAERAAFMENDYEFSCKFIIEYSKQTQPD